MTDAAALPTPLPPPPRVVRAGLGSRVGVGCGRAFLLPFVLLAVALLVAVPVRVGVQLFGRPVTATVDVLRRVQGTRGAVSFIVTFHYDLGGHTYSGSQQVTATEFARLHAGQQVPGRAATLFGRAYCATAAGDPNGGTVLVALAAVGMTGIVGLMGYVVYVDPWRTRRLMETGTAIAAEVVARRAVGGRRTTYRATYRFHPPGHPPVIRQTSVSRGEYDATDLGRPVTVIYDPDRPERNLVYEWSGYAAG